MVNMKRLTFVWLAGLLLAAWTMPRATAQDNATLGDYARQVRKQKAHAASAAKTFDNDNLPKDDKLSVVGQGAAEETQPQASNGESGAADEAQHSGAASQNPPKAEAQDDEQAQKQKMYQDWQQKIHSQQDQIDLLSRELDVLNREYRLRAAAFYADAGNRLRNSAAWDKEDAQYKDQIASKHKAIDDAKKELEDLQEQARKAGVPSSMRE
jgi:hypothetical protein